jgi:cytochrome c biogenesis protein CcmG/thiol:disulfide interchange protein DsbE
VTQPVTVVRRRRRSARSTYAIALLVLGALIGAAWLGRARFRPVVPGEAAPPFAVTALDGTPVGLDRYRGQVVLLNVWATWCAPCREEMPSMERLYRELADEDFEILAVSVDDRLSGGVPADALRAFAEEFALTFPILHSAPDDPDNIQRIYQTTGVPESFLIGPDGVIYRRISGATTWDSPQYRDQILRLLEE